MADDLSKPLDYLSKARALYELAERVNDRAARELLIEAAEAFVEIANAGSEHEADDDELELTFIPAETVH